MKVAVELDGLSREQWLEARREGIGSSDAPAICGVDRFRSPFTVWAEKSGLLAEEDETPAMRWGRILEEPIAQEYATETGLDVRAPIAMYRHDDLDYMLASPDREVFHPDGTRLKLLEIKTSALRDDWRDGVPDRTVVQVQHQLAVTGDAGADVACFVLPSRSFEVYPVERDDELIESIMRLEAEFWERVQNGEPPPTDGHRSTTETLAALYTESQEDAQIELPPEARDLVVQHHLAKQMEKDAKADLAAIDNELKQMLGTHEVGMFDGDVIVTWKAQRAKARVHNCPDCAHVPDGPPSRTFLAKKVSS